MISDPYLWRTLDGTGVVSQWVQLPHPTNFYEASHRPATAEDLRSLSFLLPEHEKIEEYLFE